ncbi:MAG TPA: hypothetical protein VKZ59_08220 [Acidobacteriota bacterium]|nr:hypothetical protein [Acidobacteriota bacterium]
MDKIEVKLDSTKIDDAIAQARKADPVMTPWGFYFRSQQRDVEDGFLWFASWVKVLRFLRSNLSNLTGFDDPERQQNVQQVVDDLIECRINKADALIRLNEVLDPAGQILWWGGLSELASGEDEFARRVRNHYAGDSTSPLPEDQLSAFAESLRSFSS